jgi:signal transduction histidine kinase
LEINPDVNEVYCDQRRLEQIIINLLSNAVKFTEQGYVRISTWLEGNNCIVSVKDCGIGIKEEQMQRLFIPFSQIDSGLSRKYEGTGLGLSICKKLITMLNGSITVASKIGKGSTFTISFPLDKEV